MNTDEHGLKRIFISPAAREKAITNRHHPNSKFDTAARQLELIFVYYLYRLLKQLKNVKQFPRVSFLGRGGVQLYPPRAVGH